MKDPIVKAVTDKFQQRSEVGIKKYGVTLEREDIDLIGWLTHLSEELQDATLYIERTIHELNKDKNGR